MTLEQAQIFFYISVPICLIIVTTIFVITRLIITIGIAKILNKIIKGIKEVEDKVKLFKTIIEELKNKFMDLKFYMDKAEKFKDQINDIKEDFEEAFDDEEEEIKPKKTTKRKTTKKSSK